MAAMSRPGTIYNTSTLPVIVNGLVIASGHDLHVDDLDGVELVRSHSSALYVVPDDEAEPSTAGGADASAGPSTDDKPEKAAHTRKKPAAEASVTDGATGPADTEETATP